MEYRKLFLINLFLEIFIFENFTVYPTIYNWWRQRKHKRETKDESHLHMSWEQDYHLQDPGRLALFDEYLEMSEEF